MRVRITLEIGNDEYEHTREVDDTYGQTGASDLLDGTMATIKRAAGLQVTT